MNDRASSGRAPGKLGRQLRPRAETTVEASPGRPVADVLLEATEEKVLRMRHGYAVPDDLALEQVGQRFADTAARLREIELRALTASGRLDELRREVGLEAEGVHAPTKKKIISGLADRLSRAPKKPSR